jgi:O-acetyl-ADP-ribose deacetylase (regulator of RNase III)
MIEIKYLQGDATAPQAEGNKIIAHVCNDIGRWGKGFVLALSKRSREPEKAFLQWYAERHNNDYGLGAAQFLQITRDTWVANIIGQHKIAVKGDTGTAPVRYEAIQQGLSRVAQKAKELNASVHMPRIGCGLAGGTWDKVEPLILSELSTQGVSVYVYDFG